MHFSIHIKQKRFYMWVVLFLSGSAASSSSPASSQAFNLLAVSTECEADKLISTKEQCEQAAGVVGLSPATATETSDDINSPKGCYVNTGDSSLYFNNVGTGTWSASAKPICHSGGAFCFSC